MARRLLIADENQDYGSFTPVALPKGSRVVFLSDFLQDWDQMKASLARVADQGIRGILIQILAPEEISFPFKGRTIFESMKRTISFEARRADALRTDYLAKLAERQDALREFARQTGWHVAIHQTDRPAQETLLWAYNMLELG